MATIVDDILAKLPHRAPFRFLSRLDAITPGVDGSATWTVTGRESFLEGHFPGQLIVPGVLIGEALAQLAGLVAWAGASDRESANQGPIAATLAHLDVRFEQSVTPPADIALHARLTRMLGHLAMCEVEAKVQGATVARGSLVLAATERRTDGES